MIKTETKCSSYDLIDFQYIISLNIFLIFIDHFGLFLHSPLADYIFFFLSLLPNFMHVLFALLFPPVQRWFLLRVSILFFCVAFRKQIYFGSEGVARDKSVFGMLKHDHVSFQIQERYFSSLDFGTKPLINMLLIVFPFFLLTLTFAQAALSGF